MNVTLLLWRASYTALAVMFSVVCSHAQTSPDHLDSCPYVRPPNVWEMLKPIPSGSRRLYVAPDAFGRPGIDYGFNTLAKLRRLVVSQVEFDHVRLTDAVDYLQRESVRLDTETDPPKRGVSMSIRQLPAPAASASGTSVSQSAPTSPPLPGLADAPVTLNLPNVSMLEALQRAAKQANAWVKVDAKGAQLEWCVIGEGKLITREFKVPPQFFDSTATTDEARKTFLASCGVTFSPNAMLCYLPASQKLVVRATQENLDLIEVLEDEFVSRTAPAPKPSNP